MSKRFMLKSVLSMIVMFFVTLSLVACGPDNQATLDDAVDDVSIVFADGDNMNSVTADLTLPTTIGEHITITWVSDNPDVISNGGVITRPDEGEDNVTVKLTATLKIGELELTTSFNVVVLALPMSSTEQEAIDALVITGEGLVIVDSKYITTDDLILEVESLGHAVVWTTSNDDVLDVDGDVERPDYGQANSTVILTATIGDETKEFIITVLAVTIKPADLRLEEAKAILLITGDIEAGVVTGNIVLADKAGVDGVTVTWESSNDEVITELGRVYRPVYGEANESVTLTATLSYGDEEVTKVFELTVRARTVAPEYTGTIATALAQDEGTFIKIEGVTIFGSTGRGFYIVDASGSAYVHSPIPAEFEIGSVVDIEAFVGVFFHALQLVGTDTDPVFLVESDADVTEVDYRNETIENIMARSIPASDNLLTMDTVTLEVKVLVDGNDVYLIPVTHEGDLDLTSAILIYDRTNQEAVETLAGKTIIIEVIIMSYHSGREVWRAAFVQELEDIIVVPLTDLQLIAIVKENILNMFEKEYVLIDNFTLETETDGVTITWDTASTLFDITTGDLTMPATGQEAVLISVTLAKGDKVEQFDITILVGEKPLQTVAEALLVDAGDLVRIQGVVTSSEYHTVFFIQDATGGMAIRTTDDDLQAFLIANYGKVIDIVGVRNTRSGLNRVVDTLIYTLIGDGVMPVAQDISAHLLDEALLLPYQGQLVELVELGVKYIDTDNWGNITITLFNTSTGSEIEMKWDSRVDLSIAAAELLAAIAVDDVITIVNPLAWSDGPFLYFTDSTIITEIAVTDTVKVEIARNMVINYFASEYNEAVTLNPHTSLFGATITYDTASTFYDAQTMMVTLPVEGREIVTVTVTIVLGDVTDTFDITFIVGQNLISEVIAAAEDEEFRIQGTITATENDRAYVVQDESGAIAMFVSNADLRAILDAAYGKTVEIVGTRGEFRGLIQISPSSIVVINEVGTTYAAVNIDAHNLDDTLLIPYQSHLVELTQMVVTNVQVNSWGTVITILETVSNNTIDMVWDVDVVLSTEAQAEFDLMVVGAIVDVTTILSHRSGQRLVFVESSIVVATATPSAAALAAAELALVNEAAADLSVPGAIQEAMTLTLPVTGLNGTTVAWTSSHNLTIDPATGVVTIPDSLITVTLTATVTLNTTEVVETFTVEVGTIPPATPDLFFSEIIEGSSNNKAIEIYNPTNAAIDMSIYEVVLYSNGDTASTRRITLTGTLAPGAVYVITNDQAGTEIAAVSDRTSNVTWFNGDDAIVLYKNGVAIDTFGVFGEDPGSYWAVGTDSTQNHTLVRNPAVTGPSAVWNPNNWIAYNIDTFTYIGSHTVN